jgi:hypothetical protein
MWRAAAANNLVIARSTCDEAIQTTRAAKQRLDCFVAEFIIGPAKGRTRWLLAMTVQPVDKSVRNLWKTAG